MAAPTLYMLLAGLASAACFAVVFRTPRRYYIHTVFIGFCSAAAMTFLPATWNVGFTSFLTALLIACMSHGFARWAKAPAQCFLIPGVIYLVPGSDIYRAFSAALAHQMDEATSFGLAAVTITVGISLGILLASWLVPPKRTL